MPLPRTGDASLALRMACLLWPIVIGTGLVETVIRVSGVLAEAGFGAGPAANIALRTVVYCSTTLLVLQLHQGHKWARTTLAVPLGCISLVTLVVPLTG